MRAELCDFTHRLMSSKTEEESSRTLLDYFKERGADGGNIWFATGVDEDSIENSIVTDYPKDFISIIYDPENLKSWSVPRLISRGSRPIRWGWELLRSGAAQSKNKEIARLAYEEFGIKNLLAIPVPTRGFVGSSGISFFSRENAKAFDRFLGSHAQELSYAGILTHARMQILRNRNQILAKLTCRERECLLWLSRGLRTKQISEKLNIREVTVNLHFANARRRLNASTREQAMAIAIMTGFIAP